MDLNQMKAELDTVIRTVKAVVLSMLKYSTEKKVTNCRREQIPLFVFISRKNVKYQ